MTLKEEKQRRKKILAEMHEESRKIFENDLPMLIAEFEKLFAYLDEKLSKEECDNSSRLTKEFLENNNIVAQRVLIWLSEHGGYCDCEILNNVKGLFDD